jgi:hypothetical protein
MAKSNGTGLAQSEQLGTAERARHWDLSPVALLVLFQPSWHGAFAAIPMAGMALGRACGVARAHFRGTYWLALALFFLALTGAPLANFARQGLWQALIWANGHRPLFMLSLILAVPLGATWLTASIRRSEQDHPLDRPGARMTAPRQKPRIRSKQERQAGRAYSEAYKRLAPQIHANQQRLNAANAQVQQVSARYRQAIELGGMAGAARVSAELDAARRDFSAALAEVDKVQAELAPYIEALNQRGGRPTAPQQP